MTQVPSSNPAPYPPVGLHNRGFNWHPVPFASPAPYINLKAWALLPIPDSNQLAPRPISPNAPHEAQASNLCSVFNAAKGVAEGAVLSREVAAILGVSEAAIPAAEADGIGAAIARATANHSIVILIAAGTGLYLLERHCAPAPK